MPPTDHSVIIAIRIPGHNPDPVEIQPLRQRIGLCGPTSLCAVARSFGIDVTIKEVDRLCRKQSGRRKLTRNYGTDHDELYGAAEELGAKVHMQSRASTKDLRDWIHVERVPVIVGWLSSDDPSRPRWEDDHLSVVYKIDEQNVYMMDPDTQGPRWRTMPISQFLPLWRDTDGSYGKKHHRWFMAADFRKR